MPFTAWPRGGRSSKARGPGGRRDKKRPRARVASARKVATVVQPWRLLILTSSAYWLATARFAGWGTQQAIRLPRCSPPKSSLTIPSWTLRIVRASSIEVARCDSLRLSNAGHSSSRWRASSLTGSRQHGQRSRNSSPKYPARTNQGAKRYAFTRSLETKENPLALLYLCMPLTWRLLSCRKPSPASRLHAIVLEVSLSWCWLSTN